MKKIDVGTVAEFDILLTPVCIKLRCIFSPKNFLNCTPVAACSYSPAPPACDVLYHMKEMLEGNKGFFLFIFLYLVSFLRHIYTSD